MSFAVCATDLYVAHNGRSWDISRQHPKHDFVGFKARDNRYLSKLACVWLKRCAERDVLNVTD